jgi:hypothetical protein
MSAILPKPESIKTAQMRTRQMAKTNLERNKQFKEESIILKQKRKSCFTQDFFLFK